MDESDSKNSKKNRVVTEEYLDKKLSNYITKDYLDRKLNEHTQIILDRMEELLSAKDYVSRSEYENKCDEVDDRIENIERHLSKSSKSGVVKEEPFRPYKKKKF